MNTILALFSHSVLTLGDIYEMETKYTIYGKIYKWALAR